MKRDSVWFEMSCTVAVLTVGMLFVMWAQRSTGCTWPAESPRRLTLTRQTDREHLARDVASAARIARRSGGSTSLDEQRTPFLACEGTLLQQIAVTHGMSPDQMQTGGSEPGAPRPGP